MLLINASFDLFADVLEVVLDEMHTKCCTLEYARNCLQQSNMQKRIAENVGRSEGTRDRPQATGSMQLVTSKSLPKLGLWFVSMTVLKCLKKDYRSPLHGQEGWLLQGGTVLHCDSTHQELA